MKLHACARNCKVQRAIDLGLKRLHCLLLSVELAIDVVLQFSCVRCRTVSKSLAVYAAHFDAVEAALAHEGHRCP